MPSIMRLWRGEAASATAAEYLERVTPVALADYKRIPGNRGAWVLSRTLGNVTEVATLSLWESMDEIRAFAGEDPEVAKYYDFDPQYLTSMPRHVEHWTVHGE